MPVLRIDQTNRGQTVLTNGRLNSLTYERGPANRPFGPKYIRLVDNVPGVYPQVIYNADLNSSAWMIPSIPANALQNELISGSNIPYVNLTVDAIPDGSSSIIEYT